jgi:hypothetical protein
LDAAGDAVIHTDVRRGLGSSAHISCFRDTGRGDLRGAKSWKKKRRKRKTTRKKRARRKKIYPRPPPPGFQGSACREVEYRRMEKNDILLSQESGGWWGRVWVQVQVVK